MNAANLKTFSDYIREWGEAPVNPAWVLQMLRQLETPHVINPAWLRADYEVSFDGVRPIEYHAD